jgi:NAD-dependent dihydropyrimidine dehydrogenase PreA subunit
MMRKIIRIDSEKCDGCGECVRACHEGAIGLRDGKAFLLRDDYCDGLGGCLPACPAQAIDFEEREAPAYDEKAVQENVKRPSGPASGADREASGGADRRSGVSGGRRNPPPCGCPGSMSAELPAAPRNANRAAEKGEAALQPSCLRHWPVQLRLVPPDAAFLARADLLIAADCAAYACGSFHQRFMAGKVTLVGCPKLDAVDYAEKLLSIASRNEIVSIVVVKMSVPCCRELAGAAVRALQQSGKTLPLTVVTLTPEGNELALPADGTQTAGEHFPPLAPRPLS